jgi:hypothetical protein
VLRYAWHGFGPELFMLRGYFRADAESGYDISANFPRTRVDLAADRFSYDIWSNDLGCFDRPYAGEKEYVLLVGDSFTHAFAPFERMWGTLLEARLGLRVLKCGVAGYGTRQELIKAKRVIERVGFPPKLIVVGYFMNDLSDDYEFPSQTVARGYLVTRMYRSQTGQVLTAERQDLEQQVALWEGYCLRYGPNLQSLKWRILQSLKCWLTRHSSVYNLAKGALKPALSRLPGVKDNLILPSKEGTYSQWMAFQPIGRVPWLKRAWSEHLDNLRAFKALAAGQGARLLVVVIATSAQVYPFLERQGATGPGYDLEQPNRVLRDFFEQEGIAYVDLLPAFRARADLSTRERLDSERDLYWRFDPHWSIKGNRLAGLIVAAHILRHGLLAVPDARDRERSVDEALRMLR